MEMTLNSHYASWNDFALKITIFGCGVGVLILLGYVVKLFSTGESKAKYDLVAKYEVKMLWIASLCVVISGGFFANSNVKEVSALWIFVRIFSTSCMVLIVALIAQNLLRFYYPFYIEKRLKKLRHKPRISPKTGKPMKLLSEEEEDAYLDEGMQAEENLFSMDYDVWRDEETGYIKIEKYAGHLHAVECPECSYQTFKVVREEVIKKPENGENGELIKHYQCAYCNYRTAETVPLAAPTKIEDAKDDISVEPS